MIRRFERDRPVPRELLSGWLDLATRAPSAGHSQGRDLLVLTTAQDRDLFWRVTADGAPTARATAYRERWLAGMRTAPVLVVCLADPGRYRERYAEADKQHPDGDPDGWPVAWWDVDTAMSALLLLLAATDAQAGGCLFGIPASGHEALREAFAVPATRRPVCAVALGYPDGDPGPRSPSLRRGRRPLGEVAHDGRFGRAWPEEPARSSLAVRHISTDSRQ